MYFSSNTRGIPRGREYLDSYPDVLIPPTLAGRVRLDKHARDERLRRAAMKINFLLQLEYRAKGMPTRYQTHNFMDRGRIPDEELQKTDTLVERIAFNTNCAAIAGWVTGVLSLDEATTPHSSLTRDYWFDESEYKTYKSFAGFTQALKRKIKKSYGIVQIGRPPDDGHTMPDMVAHTAFVWWDHKAAQYRFFEKDGHGYGDWTPMGISDNPFDNYDLHRSPCAIVSIDRLDQIRPEVRERVEKMLREGA
jgi:hypothetical protein